jgi:prepilin-type processing-associated H-X9-DG protein/prepilin-type N-terminal cleavage/methylation domain-containing protein
VNYITRSFRNRESLRGVRLNALTGVGAFTLLELLVVIAVISVLVALLLPVLSRAKSAGASAVCRSNLHQVGLAAQMYLTDYHRYPVSWGRLSQFWVVQEGGAMSLRATVGLSVYLGDENRIHNCPAQEECAEIKPWNPEDRLPGYARNDHGTGFLDSVRHLGLRERRLARGVLELPHENEVRFPSAMIAYGDCPTGAGCLDPDGPNEFTFPFLNAAPSARHNDGANILLCDGHVEHRTQARWIERNDEARSRWNIDGEPHPETWK